MFKERSLNNGLNLEGNKVFEKQKEQVRKKSTTFRDDRSLKIAYLSDRK